MKITANSVASAATQGSAEASMIELNNLLGVVHPDTMAHALDFLKSERSRGCKWKAGAQSGGGHGSGVGSYGNREVERDQSRQRPTHKRRIMQFAAYLYSMSSLVTVSYHILYARYPDRANAILAILMDGQAGAMCSGTRPFIRCVVASIVHSSINGYPILYIDNVVDDGIAGRSFGGHVQQWLRVLFGNTPSSPELLNNAGIAAKDDISTLSKLLADVRKKGLQGAESKHGWRTVTMNIPHKIRMIIRAISGVMMTVKYSRIGIAASLKILRGMGWQVRKLTAVLHTAVSLRSPPEDLIRVPAHVPSKHEEIMIRTVNAVMEKGTPVQVPAISMGGLRRMCIKKGISASGTKTVLLDRLICAMEADIATKHKTPRVSKKTPSAAHEPRPARKNAWVEFCKTKRAEVRAQGRTVSMADLSRMWTERQQKTTVLRRGRAHT